MDERGRAPGDDASQSPPSDLQRSDIEALLGRNYIGLRALIFRDTGDLQVAADLLNDAICTAWEKYRDGQIAKPEEICGYIYQVALNHLRNYRRSIGDRPEHRADPQSIDSLPSEEDDDFDIDDRTLDQVIRIMRSMDSARDRTILVRFYLDEDDKESICRDMHLTPAKFDNVLHRARRRLRDLLEAQGLKGSDVFSLVML
jgi:RNA polymerase sigma-70 factor, ECF subfamily